MQPTRLQLCSPYRMWSRRWRAFNEQVAGRVPLTAGAVLGQKQNALAALMDSAA